LYRRYIFGGDLAGDSVKRQGEDEILRASELEGKEVINIHTGDRLGIIQKSELLVNTVTGMVEALILVKTGFGGREKEVQTIPWGDIRKISEDLIIIESRENGSNISS
jgi:YlmC/YmxH family sporulation protein